MKLGRCLLRGQVSFLPSFLLRTIFKNPDEGVNNPDEPYVGEPFNSYAIGIDACSQQQTFSVNKYCLQQHVGM